MNDYDFYSKLIPAIIGAILGSMLTRYLNRNREKVTLIFDLHKEFNSYEISKHRNKAGSIIEKYPKTDYDEIAKIEPENCISLYVVMRFYQRLSLCIKYNQIKKKLAFELFGAIFYYYYYASYEKNLIHLDWAIASQIKQLAKWFERHASKKEHKRLVDKYNSKYSNLLIEFDDNENPAPIQDRGELK